MDLTPQHAREIARLINLEIPDADLENVALRLAALLSAMESIERELGAEMDRTEPVPPVYPREPRA